MLSITKRMLDFFKKNLTLIYIYIVLIFTFYTSGSIYNFVFYDFNWTIKIIHLMLIAVGIFALQRNDFEKIFFFIIGEICIGVWALLGNAEIDTYLKFILRLTFIYIFYLYGKRKKVCLLECVYYLCVGICIVYLIAWLLFDVGPLSGLGNIIDIVIEIKEGEIRSWQYTDFLHIYYRWKNARKIFGMNIIASNGPFWEPGLYQIYLNFALYYELFQKRTNFKIVFLLIFSIIVTTSTTGVFCLIIISACYLFSRLNKTMKKILVIPSVVVCSALIIYVWMEKQSYSTNGVTRINDLLVLLKKIAEHPIVGNGMGNNGAFNALFLYIVDFGIVALLLMLLFLVRILKQKDSILSKMALICWMLLSLMNEPIGYHSLFCLIVILLYTREVKESILSTESIKKFLRKHPRIDLLQYIFRKKIQHANLCYQMLELEKNPYVVRYQHCGTLNYKKPIYHIIVGQDYQIMGYCSLLRVTLLHIAYANRMGFIPVVDWKPELLYSEQNIIHGTYNSFEYFFENRKEITLDDISHSDLVIHSKMYDIRLFVDKLSYYVEEYELKILSDTIKSNLQFNEYGISEVLMPCRDIIEKGKILGLHIRGTDFKNEYSRHPVMITVDEYLDITEKTVCEGKYDYVFLATDDEEALCKFQEKFTDRLLYYDVLRSCDNQPLHYGREDKRENNKYLLGKEILQDVYTLGSCDGLIAGLSNVSIIARAIKMSTGNMYEYLKIIDKGIYSNMKESSLYIKK